MRNTACVGIVSSLMLLLSNPALTAPARIDVERPRVEVPATPAKHTENRAATSSPQVAKAERPARVAERAVSGAVIGAAVAVGASVLLGVALAVPSSNDAGLAVSVPLLVGPAAVAAAAPLGAAIAVESGDPNPSLFRGVVNAGAGYLAGGLPFAASALFLNEQMKEPPVGGGVLSLPTPTQAAALGLTALTYAAAPALSSATTLLLYRAGE